MSSEVKIRRGEKVLSQLQSVEVGECNSIQDRAIRSMSSGTPVKNDAEE
jgi:hypothetical protein